MTSLVAQERGDSDSIFGVAEGTTIPLIHSATLIASVQSNLNELVFETVETPGTPLGAFNQFTTIHPSFLVSTGAGVHSHVFYLAGEDRDGRAIIEEVSMRPANGAIVAMRTLSQASPIGQPVTTPATSIVTVGGTFVIPASRGNPVESRRSVLVSDMMPPIRSIVIDADGRFALVTVDDPGGVYRVLLDGSGSVALVVDPAVVPAAADLETIASKKDISIGRVYTAYRRVPPEDLSSTTSYAIIMVDGDNDGVLDATQVVDYLTFSSNAGVMTPGDDFINY